MHSTLPKHKKIDFLRFKTWWGVLGILALISCAHTGPSITGCMVNEEKEGFDCFEEPSRRFFLPWVEESDFDCMSTDDLESLMKSCKAGVAVPEVAVCNLTKDHKSFDCMNSNFNKFTVDMSESSHYFCMNDKDYRRILQRCKSI